jgi:xanthine/uracil permease
LSEQEPDSGYARLESQIQWYDTKSMKCQRLYKGVNIAGIVVALLIPIFAFLPICALLSKIMTSICGGAIVVLEALTQVNQWGQNWIMYRSTCEALRHEKYSFLGRSGVYADAADEQEAKKVLVQRVEALISTEHAKWISQQEYMLKNFQKNQKKR